ncbi:tRNA preQ1(34) S-adenosylmethionine ribosyltransferase-isomerase QueA [Leptospira borgpetersenii]|uniref:tRNA preQ1(34) S-adenosylmethionine ribosyltransferase-isomerase QueA n=1 Tax=Leptospira borgpetersenii TaxID=174 RepID=UPI0007748C40|nr:tRNA preQ1(34) S-adenosylmethionine ribosyltransferase-isomerase QueA [Leptospira borgpetersenii]MBE8400183.1 tRNA preQ1(34) S-adenosylmethionine ribosyltransferase-isomerase QueA [Leptospira borgpetersenii serovar Tarassovi]MBE8402584.1 tRNA preQ1(34) S-adenosylmethionine ribosyltransferase-isomerase QueA [Leptospira borgpetersenii serovar Tarassovi]MBE8406561.1 tRNA preQ1(34) S-adenosylmethionine ribosyltransferase-isomerase QueA [Leptospira borgpetersenii serovar Tarassovi]MBE8411218.1 tR
MLFEDLKEFEFTLSEERIARYPAANRDESRLMVLDVNVGNIFSESSFKNLVSYLKEGDVLVANHTKVSKRRVYLKTQIRTHETMFLEEKELLWKCKIRNSKKLKVGTKLSDEKTQRISFTVEKKEGEFVFLKPEQTLQEENFQQIGEIPIPPYFKRNPDPKDEIRYQTLFAKTPGSVAAPTAGLHFSESIFQTLKEKKIRFCTLELKVGYGTFQPLTEENFQNQKLHREEFFLEKSSTEILNLAKKEGRRIFSIGTTTLRALESAYDYATNSFRSGRGTTELFIQPEDRLKSCECLITNFHLPSSSLLLLVSAFAGKELVLKAYQKAIQEKFRFYSYGDAMLILGKR